MFVFQLHGQNKEERRCNLQINFTNTGIQALITYLNWNFVSPHNLNASLKEGLPHIPARQSPSHIGFKHLRVIPQHCSSIMIKRILPIWFLKEKIIEGKGININRSGIPVAYKITEMYLTVEHTV